MEEIKKIWEKKGKGKQGDDRNREKTTNFYNTEIKIECRWDIELVI